ncbi:hypothetical protein GCM10010924_18210 [Rhizobium wenxiniae]|nr:hypothetical protein GCM10010924_18210 [Rhizobium wenxiniae]
MTAKDGARTSFGRPLRNVSAKDFRGRSGVITGIGSIVVMGVSGDMREWD